MEGKEGGTWGFSGTEFFCGEVGSSKESGNKSEVRGEWSPKKKGPQEMRYRHWTAEGGDKNRTWETKEGGSTNADRNLKIQTAAKRKEQTKKVNRWSKKKGPKIKLGSPTKKGGAGRHWGTPGRRGLLPKKNLQTKKKVGRRREKTIIQSGLKRQLDGVERYDRDQRN